VATTALLTKRAAFLWLALGLIAGLTLASFISFAGTAKADEHTTGVEAVRTDTLEADFVPGTSRMGTEVWFRGSGFVPGTSISVLVKDSNGVWTDISVPAESRRDGGGSVADLVANDDGAWATNWRIGRFSRANVGGEGMFSAVVVDADFNVLATTPLALCNLSARAEGEAVPDYCSA
jgi:hypothetical protein